MAIFLDLDKAKQYECAVCQSICEKPILVSCGEHMYCAKCVDALTERSKGHDQRFPCPQCRKDCYPKNFTAAKFVERQINELEVKCSNYCQAIKSGHKKRKLSNQQACEWTGSYKDFKTKHQKTCPFASVFCGYCGKSVLQSNLNGHYRDCESYPIECEECKQPGIKRSDMDNHITNECPMTIVECKKCKAKFERAIEKKHRKDLCPEQWISCPYKKFGCAATMQRKDLKEHKEKYKFAHDELTVEKLNKMDKIIKKQTNRISDLEATIRTIEAGLRTVSDYYADNDNDSDDMTVL